MRANESVSQDEARRQARQVVRRIRNALGVCSDREIGPRLGRRDSVAANWTHRGSVPDAIIETVSEISKRSADWIRHGDSVRELPGPYRKDIRLEAITEWWKEWWASASEEERVWALVQLRRAFPESAEPIRRRVEERAAEE